MKQSKYWFISTCSTQFALTCYKQHTHTHIHFVRDYPGEPVPKPIWILLKQETMSGSVCFCCVKLFQVWQVIAKEQIMSESVFGQWLKILTDDVVTVNNCHLCVILC